MLAFIVVGFAVVMVASLVVAVRWVLQQIPDSYSFWHELKSGELEGNERFVGVVWPKN